MPQAFHGGGIKILGRDNAFLTSKVYFGYNKVKLIQLFYQCLVITPRQGLSMLSERRGGGGGLMSLKENN
jgi:hypothetical protein